MNFNWFKNWFRKSPIKFSKASEKVMNAFTDALDDYKKINIKINKEKDILTKEIADLEAQVQAKDVLSEELTAIALKNQRMVNKLTDFINN